MVISNKQRECYVKSCVKLLSKIAVKGQVIDFPEYNKEINNLMDRILENDILRLHIRSFELYISLLRLVHSLYLEKGQEKEGVFNEADIKNSALEFINFLEGIPYEYSFYFLFPIDIPKKIKIIKISDNVQIVRQEIDGVGDIQQNKLVNILSGQTKIPKYERVFLKVDVLGYGENAQEQAVTILKRFLYLTSLTGLLISSSWERTEETIYKQGFSNCPSIDDNKISTFALANDMENYISGVKLSDKIFDGFTPPKKGRVTTVLTDPYKTYEDFFDSQFKYYCGSFIKLQNNKEPSEIEYIFSAIEWASDGMINHNETMGFIQTCIGIEALLGDTGKKNEETEREERGLTAKLADRCAYLLGNNRIERDKLYRQFKKIYHLRSKLVHGTAPKVSEKDGKLIWESEKLLKKMIHKEI